MQPSYKELAELLKQALAEIEILKSNISALTAENQVLRKEIEHLNEKLNTNSSNSSKPPSRDPNRYPKKRKPSEKKQGAQQGHKGHKRKLVPEEQVQIFHNVYPNVCPECSSVSFGSEIVRTEVRQVIELPEMPPEVTQYNIHTCQCDCCGKHVKAEIPNDARFGFGPRLMGFITSLSGEFRLSKRSVTALMGKIGIRICSGTVCNIHARASQILEGPYNEIKARTLQENHLNADETSWKTLSNKRWLWIGSSEDYVFFQIENSRSTHAFRQVFGPFKGGLTTDRYNVYNSHEGQRQLCWAHTERDLQKIASRPGADQWIGKQLLEFQKNVFLYWHQFRDGFITRDELIQKVEQGPKGDMKLLFKAGAIHEDCRNKTKATCYDFYDHFDMLWTFLYHEGIEPTNNRGEQRLRFGVIWRKLCYGSQSEVGERFVERIMTVAMTLQQQSINTLAYFTNCFRVFIKGGHSPPVFS